MRRRLGAVAIAAVLLLTGCTPTYSSPDERSHARGDAIYEEVLKIEPQPADVLVAGGYDGVYVRASLGDMTFADTRDFIEQALQLITDSPLGALPPRFELGHASARGNAPALKWWGWDPAESERYFTALEVWFDVLADSATEFDDEVSVQRANMFGTIQVFDDRDLEAYRAEIVDRLEAAGYEDPGIRVELGTTN